MNVHAAIPAAIDLATVKRRQQVAWGSGDYAVDRHHVADRR